VTVKTAPRVSAARHTSYMATGDSESETRQREYRLERANRVRAELGLPPLTAAAVEHDRRLASATSLRLWPLIDVCAAMKRDRRGLD
jgi:hypothetical protein